MQAGTAAAAAPVGNSPQLLGHPTGLFNLFFAEMWERFSYYGMRALLVFYMTKDFLKFSDSEAYTVYGAYTALVYMTPFLGGLLADRLLGQRLAVILGGILMAAGHLLMGIANEKAFYFALALVIIGNGFFKPNISTIVGSLYAPGSPRRDAGYTIFYMGVNMGAAMSPLLCGYIGENYGWHRGFGLATIGMMVGLAVFVMPNLVTQLMIGVGSVAAVLALLIYRPDDPAAIALNVFVAICLAVAAVISILALGRGGLSKTAGAAKTGPVSADKLGMVLGGVVLAIPVVALFVSGFKVILPQPLQLLSEKTVQSISSSALPGAKILAIFAGEVSKPAGLLLTVTGILAFGSLILQTLKMQTIARHRMIVVLTLTFFSMLFWSFFEQAGSSLNNFADRNVDRVASVQRLVAASDVGSVIQLQPTQEQLGYTNGGAVFTLDQLDKLRAAEAEKGKDAKFDFVIDWKVDEGNVGMAVAERRGELAASTFQAVNAVCILIFGLVFTAIWSWLGARGLDPSPAVKFALGLIQVGLGFGAFWYGAVQHDARGMVGVSWLLLGYVLHTTGELCLSPVGLSMIARLAPKVLVSTVMGAWFLATAFSQYLAAIISQLTGGEHGGGADNVVPGPLQTVMVYGDVFKQIMIVAVVSGLVCLALSPILSRWTHPEAPEDGAG
jgi:POT family proton-dependent oligopeptide transporter